MGDKTPAARGGVSRNQAFLITGKNNNNNNKRRPQERRRYLCEKKIKDTSAVISRIEDFVEVILFFRHFLLK